MARRIRAAPWGESLVLVALTGWSQEADRRRTRETGFDWHLVKPLDFDALTEFLSHLPPLDSNPADSNPADSNLASSRPASSNPAGLTQS